MDQILTFFLKYCSFLFTKCGCRFTDSEVSTSFGGDAWLILSAKNVRLRFVSDRGQLFLDFQSVGDQCDKSWYSIDIVRQLVNGEDRYHAQMDEGNAEFLKSHFAKIEELFSAESFPKVRRRLVKLEQLRSKRLFS